jgi:uncharacterized NAD-dependent epimerase/dehydratase family protein
MLEGPRRIAVLAEGCFAPLEAKTAVGMLRYRPEEVVAIIDSTRAGRDAQACVGVGGKVPVVEGLEAAAARGANALLVGIAPQGGGLPAAWRPAVRGALERGWDVVAGLHVFLADDPEFAALAAARGARLVDLRRPPAERRVAAGRAANLDATVVLTVGTDCNVGKMTAALEIVRALQRAGTRAAFVATGQTGLLIGGRGAAVDAVAGDFIAGAIEHEVVEAARDADVVVVEGQGALHHPGFSGVTLGLLHGACPAALVLCHEAGRERLRISAPDAAAFPIPTLAEAALAAEAAAAWVRPARVVGVALNTWRLEETAARDALDAAAREAGVPAADPVRFGAQALAAAVLEARARGMGRDHAADA